jgi:D-3-phosphoglycerate dehydrogenase
LSTRTNEMCWDVPVVFADRFFMADESLAEISSLGGYVWAEARDHQDLAAKLNGSTAVRVIVSEYVSINAGVLEQAPGLKGVIAYGAGYDHIDVDFLSRRGIQACNCRGENAQAVAELTFGLLLCLLRRIHRADRWVREGEWPRAGRSLPPWATGQELWRKTLGIIGLGQIGRRVAKIADGFQMKIYAYDPFVKPAFKVEAFPLREVLARADILTLHVPLTSKTEKMIDASSLAAVKPGAILVNTSRGRVIDEPALIQALKDGRIGGAALDVSAREPLPGEHTLTRMENVVLSPHMGAMTQEAGERLSSAVARQARDILEGRTPECLINMEK